MKYLAIDTSGGAVVALVVNGEKRAAFVDPEARHASEVLLPNIDRMSDEVGLSLRDADFVACTVGPGSFTGIRIGIATTKIFASVAEIKAIAVNSLKKLAYNVTGKNATLCATHAYADFAYVAVYAPDGTELVSPLCLPYTELDGFVAGHADCTFVTDAHTAEKLGRGIKDDPIASLAAAAEDAYEKGLFTPHSKLEPYYLLESQAERDLKAGKL